MPWRDEIEIDAVEYSDRPLSAGPAPNDDGHEVGRIAELTACADDRTYDVELQFWTADEADVAVENPVSSAAGYYGWRIAARSGAVEGSGAFGVFDGHAERVWLGTESFRDPDAGETYAFIDIGTDWREKLYWNDFVDRIYVEHVQYPFEQDGDLEVVPDASIVEDDAAEATAVYELETTQLSTTARYRLQLWRPPGCQAVFVAVEYVGYEAWCADRGVLGKRYVLSDTGRSISFSEETYRTLRDRAAELRSRDPNGLEHVT